MSVREAASEKLLKSLYKVLLKPEQDWDWIKMAPSQQEQRILVLRKVAAQAEFSIHSHSSTREGYEDRVQIHLDAVKLLPRYRSWKDNKSDEYEEGRDWVALFQRVCTKSTRGV